MAFSAWNVSKKSVFNSENNLEPREEAGGIGYSVRHLFFHSQAFIELLMCVRCSLRCQG